MKVEQRSADVTLRVQGETAQDNDTVLLQRSRQNVGTFLVHDWHASELATAILPTDARAGSSDPQGCAQSVLAFGGYFSVRGNARRNCQIGASWLSERQGVSHFGDWISLVSVM